MKILKDDDRIRVVRYGNYVSKQYKNLTKERNFALLGKLELKDKLRKIPGFITPFDYEVKDGKVKEIYTKYVDYPNFCYDISKDFFSFEVISKCLTNLNKTLREGHKNGVVFLDFISEGNLKYNPETFEVFLIDYEDCQIKDYDSFAWSYKLQNSGFINEKKYRSNKKFTKDADLYLLTIMWFNMCTSLSLEFTNTKPSEMLNLTGMEDSKIINKILLCYDLKKENEYYDTDFIRVYKDYLLEELSEDNFFRSFVKKCF